MGNKRFMATPRRMWFFRRKFNGSIIPKAAASPKERRPEFDDAGNPRFCALRRTGNRMKTARSQIVWLIKTSRIDFVRK